MTIEYGHLFAMNLDIPVGLKPGTKSKLSLSVATANDCGRPPRICRRVTCSSCCSVPTSKALMVDLCSDVLRIMDFIFQALNDTGRFFTRKFAGLGQRAGADAGKEWVSGELCAR